MSETVHLFIIGLLATSTIGAFGYANRIAASAHKRMDQMQKDIYDYRVFIAQQFATTAVVNGLKADVDKRFDRLDDKLDALLGPPRLGG